MFNHYFMGEIFIGFLIISGNFNQATITNSPSTAAAVEENISTKTTTPRTTSTTIAPSTSLSDHSSSTTSSSNVFSSSEFNQSNATNFPSISDGSTKKKPVYKVHGVRVIKRYERDPYVLRINSKNFHMIGENLNNIKEAWLSTLGHCIEEDPTKMNVKLYQQLQSINGEEEEFARNASVNLPESDQVYHFCVKTSNGTLVKSSFEAWRPFIKLAKEPDSSKFFLPLYLQIPLIVFLAFLSALFSGLNVGLMSLSVSSLELIIKHDQKKKQYAQNILPLRKNGNLLLCTILIGNTFVNNAMTLLVSNLIEEAVHFELWLNFILSVILPATIIVFIGEIVPQAICCRYGLIIGSKTRYITIFFIVLTFVVSFPLSKILDRLIGTEGPESLDKATLEHIIDMNVEQVGGFTRNIADIAQRALKFEQKAVEIMTPIDEVFMLPDTAIIDKELVTMISENGYTRIPIYKAGDENNIIGILNVKDLVPIDQKCKLTIGTIIQIWQRSKHLRYVCEDISIHFLLKEMKRGQPMALVIQFNDDTKNYKIVGIIALEDIIEELTGEILDEKDVKRAKKKTKKKLQ